MGESTVVFQRCCVLWLVQRLVGVANLMEMCTRRIRSNGSLYVFLGICATQRPSKSGAGREAASIRASQHLFWDRRWRSIDCLGTSDGE